MSAAQLPKVSGEALNLTKSMELLAQAEAIVPGTTQSLMKRPEQFAYGSFPVFIDHGDGALVTDVDGNQYIDYICGLGATTLGHNHPAVVEAIRNNLDKGLIHSLPTEVELRATQALLDIIPNAEMARFFKTGADATSAAVRLARHVTKRERIITVGYNGWHDHFMYYTPGVPAVLSQYTEQVSLMSPHEKPNLIAAINKHGDQLAAVLLSMPYKHCLDAEYLNEVKAACHAVGALFVLDEVVTGFRLALGGAQEFYGVDADFVCLSKGIAAGMPLSAIAGPKKYLERLSDLQVSTTFGGEMLSLEVCYEVINVYRNTNYFAHVASLGQRLREGVNAKAEALGVALRVCGYDAIPFFAFAPDMPTHARLMEALLGAVAKHGVILRRDVNFLTSAHTAEQIDFTIEAVAKGLQELLDRGIIESTNGKEQAAG